MPSRVGEAVLGEPSGRRHAGAVFAGALVPASPYAYSETVGGPSSNGWLLSMVVGSALSGVAESLPAERRRAAGALRATATPVLAGPLAPSVVAPDLIVG